MNKTEKILESKGIIQEYEELGFFITKLKRK